MNEPHFLSFQLHNGSGSSGIAENVEGFLMFIESLQGKSLMDIISSIFPGISGMVNVHPLVVHFPIAFLIGYFVIDLMGTLFKQPHWRTVASGLLYLGTISVIFAVIAGFLAAGSVAHNDVVHAIMTQHQKIGLMASSLAVILSIWRLFSKGFILKGLNVLHLILSALLSSLIIFGADLGGLMVYKHGVAVERPVVVDDAPSDFQEHSHHDHAH